METDDIAPLTDEYGVYVDECGRYFFMSEKKKFFLSPQEVFTYNILQRLDTICKKLDGLEIIDEDKSSKRRKNYK